MAGGKVITIHTKAEWDQQHADAKNSGTPILVDFSATWCGPCRMISPYFEELSVEYPNVTFLKVDVDEVEAVASACGISAMPTFQLWVGGAKVDEVVGASKQKLKEIAAGAAAGKYAK